MRRAPCSGRSWPGSAGRGSDTLPGLAAFLELHIEQGTELEAAGVPVGVVTHALAQRWYEGDGGGCRHPCRLAHGGAAGCAGGRTAGDGGGGPHRPRPRRHGHHRAAAESSRAAATSRPSASGSAWTRATPTKAALDSMGAALRAGAAGLGEVRDFWHSPGLRFDPTLVAHLREAAAARGLPWREMPTVIGHDAVHLARQVPTAMVFVPCHGGVSHNPAEASRRNGPRPGCWCWRGRCWRQPGRVSAAVLKRLGQKPLSAARTALIAPLHANRAGRPSPALSRLARCPICPHEGRRGEAGTCCAYPLVRGPGQLTLCPCSRACSCAALPVSG
jgi:hypothetical protein